MPANIKLVPGYSSYSEVSKLAFDKMQNGALDEALEIYNAIWNHCTDDTIVPFYLSNIYFKKGHIEHAAVLLRDAIKRRSDFADAMINLGCIYKKQQKTDEARKTFENAACIILNDVQSSKQDQSMILSNLASTYVANGTPEKAKELLVDAIEADYNNEDAHWNLGLTLLEMGDYEHGFSEYEYGRRTLINQYKKYGKHSATVWDGRPNQVVVVYGEQGIGDEIMFASILPDMMNDCQIIFDAHIRLTELFRNSFPEEMMIYGTREGPDVPWADFIERIDAFISIGSIAKFYRKKLEDFPRTPYLRPNENLAQEFRKKLTCLSNRKKIGISWKGGIPETNMNDRTIPLSKLLPIFEYDADFISLQYNKDVQEELNAFQHENGINIYHWQEALDDYDQTAALVSNLDLVVSVPQSVVHLAGAMGVSTIQMCPKRAMWQMGPYGKNMPWYQCVGNVWQTEHGQWDDVVLKTKERVWNILQTSTEN